MLTLLDKQINGTGEYNNVASVFVLIGVILLVGALVCLIVMSSRKKRASGNPACCGCPNAKGCYGACTCSSGAVEQKENENADKDGQKTE